MINTTEGVAYCTVSQKKLQKGISYSTVLGLFEELLLCKGWTLPT